MGGSRPRDAATSCQDQEQGLKIMYTNARSIVNKIDELKSFVHTHVRQSKSVNEFKNSYDRFHSSR